MPYDPYELPSMTTLRAFEAAARNGAFNEASAELNVTPGAISHQVKALERGLGVALFVRGHRSVDLTDEGAVLYAALQQSFQNISQTVGQLRRQGTQKQILIGTTTAISTFWLTKQIALFWRDHGEIVINQHLSDARFNRPLKVELAVEYCITPPAETRSVRLFGDELTPVCSPKLASELAEMSLADLAQSALIHMDAPNRNWTTWGHWFAEMGHQDAVTRGRKVNNYAIALQLACEGQGVVLGWKRLIAPLLISGALVAPVGFSCRAPGAFYLVWAEGNANPAAEIFVNWMKQRKVNSIHLSQKIITID